MRKDIRKRIGKIDGFETRQAKKNREKTKKYYHSLKELPVYSPLSQRQLHERLRRTGSGVARVTPSKQSPSALQ